MTKCLEIHQACQESVCDVGENTKHYSLVLDTVNRAQSTPRHFINSLPKFHFWLTSILVV